MINLLEQSQKLTLGSTQAFLLRGRHEGGEVALLRVLDSGEIGVDRAPTATTRVGGATVATVGIEHEHVAGLKVRNHLSRIGIGDRTGAQMTTRDEAGSAVFSVKALLSLPRLRLARIER